MLRRKVLFITEYLPWPLDSGGKIRTFNILKELATEYDITLLCCHRSSSTAVEEFISTKVCTEVRAFPSPPRVLRELSGVYLAFKHGFPHFIARHYVDAFSKTIRTLNLKKFSAIHFDHLDSTTYFHLLPRDIPMFLDEHNIVSVQMASTLKSIKSIVPKTYIKYQITEVREYEARIASKMSTCFVCSENDKKRLRHIAPDARIKIVPNGVDLDYFRCLKERDYSKKAIIFVGSMDYLPNVAGVEWFIENVWPQLSTQFPDLKFYVVGKNPPLKLAQKFSRLQNVEIVGRVLDVRPYYFKALVSVVPLLSGSGTRLKILEAMAMGTPVVSTSLGAEGIKYADSVNICIANTPKMFVEKISILLENRKLNAQMADAANELVRTKYTWTAIAKELREVYMSIAL